MVAPEPPKSSATRQPADITPRARRTDHLPSSTITETTKSMPALSRGQRVGLESWSIPAVQRPGAAPSRAAAEGAPVAPDDAPARAAPGPGFPQRPDDPHWQAAHFCAEAQHRANACPLTDQFCKCLWVARLSSREESPTTTHNPRTACTCSKTRVPLAVRGRAASLHRSRRGQATGELPSSKPSSRRDHTFPRYQ